jgi:hypothetical protein
VQSAGFAHDGFGDLMSLRDVGQFVGEHTGEREQVV